MTHTKTFIAAATAAASLAAGPAGAALSAASTTDLNLRAGPGPQYGIETVIPADAEVSVAGCLDAGDWCEVTYDGTSGWAYSAYLTTPVEEDPVVLYENREMLEVETVTYEEGDPATGAAAVGTFGAAVGSLAVGGPAAVAAGAVIGAAIGADNAVEEDTVTYIRSTPVEPVYLNGEVAVGAGIPQEVTLYDTPNAVYRYGNINDLYVVVDPETRRIIRVIR